MTAKDFELMMNAICEAMDAAEPLDGPEWLRHNLGVNRGARHAAARDFITHVRQHGLPEIETCDEVSDPCCSCVKRAACANPTSIDNACPHA